MAGAGSRFHEAGYLDPKPMIDVNGKPMFVIATQNVIDLAKPATLENLIFIIDDSMNDLFNLSKHIKKYFKDAKVVTLSERTNGAASTVRAAGAYLDPTIPVIVANCDQLVEFKKDAAYNFSDVMKEYDAAIVVFDHPERDPKWSYAEIGHQYIVKRVAEKDPISDFATVGIYYWSNAAMLFNSIGQMMIAKDRINDEFYLCPAFNYTIASGNIVSYYKIDKMHGLGTPEDLEKFLARPKD